ncbi:hypothetical protein ACFE04_002549 [Oxalis oulophora]
MDNLNQKTEEIEAIDRRLSQQQRRGNNTLPQFSSSNEDDDESRYFSMFKFHDDDDDDIDFIGWERICCIILRKRTRLHHALPIYAYRQQIIANVDNNNQGFKVGLYYVWDFGFRVMFDSWFEDSLKLKEDMLQVYGVKPDAYVYDDEAFSVLEEMKSNRCNPNTMTYNVIINGFVREKDFESAYTNLHEMVEKGCKPLLGCLKNVNGVKLMIYLKIFHDEERHAKSYYASEESYGGWKQSSFEN